MKKILPPGLKEADFNAALKDFGQAIGAEWVLSSEVDMGPYQDFMAIHKDRHQASAAVAPITTEEVQKVVRIANKYGVPLWVTGRGKNFGYGSAAPVVDGCVVLDLTRMKKIEFDATNGVVIVEPGVGFYDLLEYLEAHNLPFWMSAPGNGWGSVMGNALERGVGYTPYGDHAARIHGMEVVMPDGDLVRTNMGAMENSSTWHLHPYGFGPSWDQVFVQSNFGVVTRMGLWLMPEPESVVSLKIELDKEEDLGWVVETLGPMRREGLIQQSPTIGNWLRAIALFTVRSEWYDKPGPFPESVVNKVREKFNVGWWSLGLNFYGRSSVTNAAANIVKDALSSRSGYEVKQSEWKKGMPRGRGGTFGGVSTLPLRNAAWYGGRGGHVSFSPVLPQTGEAAMEQFYRTKALYEEYEIDYHPGFNLGERHMTNVNQIMFNRDDPDMVKRVDGLFEALVLDAAKKGYGEYRSHISYMDLIASTFDFNDNALWRMNEKVKNALDVNGILSPGKNGIWPKKYKEKV